MKRALIWLIGVMICLSVARGGDVKITVVTSAGEKGKPTTVFTADTPEIWATFKTKGAKKGDKLRGEWIADEVGDAAPPNTKIVEKILTLEQDNGGGYFTFLKPTNGWPPGKYHLDIYAGDELATTVKFTVEAMEKAEKRAAAEKAAGGPPDLNGKWIGYYDDGSKSEYVWSIRQTGSTLAISNVGGETATSKGWVEGEKVVAEDFPTSHGKLSADGKKITWTDGVVWKKQ